MRAGDDVLTAVPDENGTAYFEGVQLRGGETTLQTTIHRADWPDSRTSLMVEADPPSYVHAPVVSSARIGGFLAAAAGALAFVGVGLAFIGRRRRVRSGNVVHASITSATGDAEIESRQVVDVS